MKRTLTVLMTIAFVFSIAFVARAAPTKQKAFTSNAAVAEQVAPVANLVPVMTGYDVIENLTTELRDLSIAQNTFDGRYFGTARLSTTGAWRSHHYASYHGNARSSPAIVMIA